MKHIKLFENFSEESESSPIEDFYKKYYPSSLTASLDPNSQEAKALLLDIDLNLGRIRASDDTVWLQKKSAWGDIFPTYKEIWKTDDAELSKLVDNIYKNKRDTQLNEEGVTPEEQAKLDAAASSSAAPATSLPKLEPGTVITGEGRSPAENMALRFAEADYARKTQGQPSTRADGSTKHSQEGMTHLYTITGTIK